MTPDLSCIVPSHNAGEGLLGVLEALHEATDSLSREVIVIDDGSRDGSIESAQERFPEIRLFRHPTAKGAAAARNAGIGHARGALLCFVDSDVVVGPDSIEALLAAIEGVQIAHSIPYLEGEVPMSGSSRTA